MGGAVSSGRDNNELIDNLMGGNYIRTRMVERVFRALDRADYMTPEARDQAYKDLAWRNGPLHMSAPCIYSEVMEGLELKPGLSFLNIGSGTGYLSTLVGLILGSGGINHGVEVHPLVVDYANKNMTHFMENSSALDEFDFCEPKFYAGNGLCLAPLQAPYDRVYCGAGCPEEYQNYFKQLVKVGGVLVMPLNDKLVQVRRVAHSEWSTHCLLSVSFATLRVPNKDESANPIKLEEQTPARLQVLSRAAIRSALRRSALSRHPQLRPPDARRHANSKPCPRRICIPIEDDSDVEGLNALHDLDRASGANEMNALLSLVLSMGQNRVAGALRFDSLDSPSESSSDEDDPNGDGGGDDADDGNDGGDAPSGTPPSPPLQNPPENDRGPQRTCRGVLTFEFQENADGSISVTDPTALPVVPGVDTERRPEEEPGNSNEDAPSVPAEVEIYLGKQGTSRSVDMDWDGLGARGETSDDETTEEASKETKRQKLDSGIGEGTTPSSSSPAKSESKTDESDAEAGRSDSLTDEGTENGAGRRRLQKRGRCQVDTRSSSSTEGDENDDDDDDEGTARRRSKRRAAAPSADARRLRLSVVMKRAIKDLPLPNALKKFVNLERCFDYYHRHLI